MASLIHRRCPAAIGVLATFLLLAVALPACAKKTTAIPVGGNVGFNQDYASTVNGPIPAAQPGYSCGSETAEFAAELVDTAPNKAKVMKEWGDVVPGKQMFISGTIKNIVFSMGDLTFTHPLGLDFTFDVEPDPAYTDLAQVAGTGESEGGPEGTIHMEIQQGSMPHFDTVSINDFMPGFIPSVGDRVATFGRWIVDCGHNDYHTEIHPTVFLAFAHSDGSSTVVHTFYNPYYETQLFNPDPSLVNQVTNTARFDDPNTKPFPGYLVATLLRIGHLGPPGPLCCADRIEAHILESANTMSPIPWYVCATGDGSPAVTYDFVTRPGVSVRVGSPNADTGCLQVRTDIAKSYVPPDPTRKDCIDPWEELTAQAEAATGNTDLDIKKLIEAQVPASFVKSVERDPVVDCYDFFTGPALSEVGSGTKVTQSTETPFPFYGWIKVSR
jgi:hypothetical protein